MSAVGWSTRLQLSTRSVRRWLQVSERLSVQFATVYVTVASVLLGLALEDLVSVVRGIEDRDTFVWIASVFIVHIIMNAWIGYSSVAIAVNLQPNPWDALNVFLLSASHFALNSFVGADPGHFFVAAGVYSLTGGAITYYNTWRASHDPSSGISPAGFRGVFLLNGVGGIFFLGVGLLSLSSALPEVSQLLGIGVAIPFATGWLVEFWRSWSRARSPDA